MSEFGNASARPAVGDLLAGRYRLEALVGRGGMASVYRAADEALGRTVAIKVFESELAHAGDVRRQREEITLLATLNHPNLVTLFDAVADDVEAGIDRAFLVLEFVDGNDLSTALGQGPLDAAATASLGADVAEALEHIHSNGVVHRDVKPGNILLPAGTGTRRATAKLTDFGIARLVDGAKLTETGTFLGTASYLSPEQARGETVGPPSDVYSLGLVLLECLTGERAFPGSALESTAARLAKDPDIPARLGADWHSILRAMTSRLPDSRPGAAQAARLIRSVTSAELKPDPTLVLPSFVPATEPLQSPTGNGEPEPAPTANTEAAATAPANPDLPTSAGGTERVSGRKPRVLPRKVPPLVWAALGAVVLIPVFWLGVSGLTALLPTGATTPTAIPYPVIEGDLGNHLEQLQKTVEP